MMVVGLALFSCTEKQNGLPPEGTEGMPAHEEKAIRETLLYPGEYIAWIKDPAHSFYQEKIIRDISFSALYKPYEYIACQEQRTDSIKETTLVKYREELGGMQYFDLRIAISGGTGELLKHQLNSAGDYEKRVDYFAFDMQNDIRLIEAGDTLPCSLFHFERIYDVAPYSSFLLGFPVSGKKSESKTLVFHDKVFNKGIIKFVFNAKNIATLPKLKTL